MSRLEPESNISHYKIKELIASGGMGEVYRAIDLQLGRVVALKTILPNRADDPNSHQRFLREARAASILSHPSICTIYEIGKDGELTFIAMQYIQGKTVQEMLSEGQMPVVTVLACALDIADALHEAHRHGVIHRDIKPSNIIVNERDIAVVLDFGLATQVSFAGTLNEELPTLPHLTSATTLLGTVPYMPPEEIRGEPMDERSDIFSLGVTLYEMLGGMRPFDRPNKIDLLHAILHDEPKSLTELRATVDPGLNTIIAKALKKNPGERYQSAPEFKQEVLEYIHKTGHVVRSATSASANTKLTRVAAVGQRWPLPNFGSLNLRTTVITGLATAILVLGSLGGILWLLLKTSDSDSSRIWHYVQVVYWKSEPGEVASDAVFSPDGRMIAFSSIRGKYRDIWIKQTAMGDPIQITKGEWNSWNPIWSSDNQQLAFVSRRGDQTGVWRVPAFGGTPTLIKALNGDVRLKHWSKAGQIIYYELRPNLFALNVNSGQVTQITKFESSKTSDPRNLAISPGEDQIAYLDRKGNQVDIWIVPTTGGSPVRITNDSADDRTPVWHSDGKRIIYSSVRDGIYQICVANVDGRAPKQLTSGESDKFALDAGDGEILYYASKEESDIWRVNIDNAEESAFTSDPGTELWPDVSPDGKMVAYQSVNDPSQGSKLSESQILTRLVTSGVPAVQRAARGINPTWSPDGKMLGFLRSTGDLRNIWTAKTSGGEEKQLTTQGCDIDWSTLPYNRVETTFFSWSPDSRKILYHYQEDDKSKLSVINADGMKASLIAESVDSFLSSPLWSLDGTRVAYVAQTRSRSEAGNLTWSIKLVDLETNQSETIFQGNSALRLLGWGGDENDLLVIQLKGLDHVSVRATAVDLISVSRRGQSQEIAQLSAAYSRNTLLSPDRRMIAYVARQDGNDNIWLVPARGGAPKQITSNHDPRLYFSSMAFSPDGKTIYFGKQSRSSIVSMIDNFK
jgi:serine/threonine protein kinase